MFETADLFNLKKEGKKKEEEERKEGKEEGKKGRKALRTGIFAMLIKY